MRTKAEAAAREEAAATRKQLQAQLDQLTQQRQSLIDQIAAKPPNADLLNQQLTSVVNQYGNVYDQLQSVALRVVEPRVHDPPTGRRHRDQRAGLQLPHQAEHQRPEPAFAGRRLGGTKLRRERTWAAAPPCPSRCASSWGQSAGLVLGLISAFVVEAWDDRIRRRERVEELTGLPVLAEVPRLTRDESRNHLVAVADTPTGAASERYRAARSSVLFAMDALKPGSNGDAADRKVPVVMVTSPGPSEGKTTTACNLAAAFADGGMRTLVIDGDSRRPSVRRYLSPVPNLVAPDDPSETRIERVWFLPGPRGTHSPDEAVLELRRSIDRWRDDYDIVVLDTPPILTTNDAADLLAAADTVVLVLRSGQTRTGPARRVVGLLNRYRADVLGVVLNSCDRSEMDPYYGYGYGYVSKSPTSGKNGGKNGESERSGRGSRSKRSGAGSEPEPEIAEFWQGTNGNGNGNGAADDSVDHTPESCR